MSSSSFTSDEHPGLHYRILVSLFSRLGLITQQY
jgi:hypothetical protein